MSEPAFWRIKPKRSAPDVYRRKYETHKAASDNLRLFDWRRRRAYKVVAYSAAGKVLDV
jgi:hypothetical protein